jgi:hypothetical protein
MAIRQMPEIELHAGLKAPVERHLVDGDGARATVHRGVVVPRGVHVRAVVRGELHAFDGPALAIGQILGLQARKEPADVGCRLRVSGVGDGRPVTRRIGRDVVFEWNRKVDESARHRRAF